MLLFSRLMIWSVLANLSLNKWFLYMLEISWQVNFPITLNGLYYVVSA